MTTAPRTGNGWPVLKPGDPRLATWKIPGANRRLTTRRDQVGFLLVFWATFWNEKVERLDGPGNDPVDEGSHSYREIRKGSGWSEHAAAAALDLNWAKHPHGSKVSATFTKAQVATIVRGEKWLNRLAGPGSRVIEWGGHWPSHPASKALTDSMHVQVVRGRVLLVVRILARTARGKRVLKANPWVRISGVKA